MPKTLTKVEVIANQIENTNDWKYIGSDIGIAIAWVMKSANKEIWHVMRMIMFMHQEH